MKRSIFAIALLFCGCGAEERQAPAPEAPSPHSMSVIPRPNSVTTGFGTFVVGPDVVIVAGDENSVLAAELLNASLGELQPGKSLPILQNIESGVAITLETLPDAVSNSESYELIVESNSIRLKGQKRGLFHGVQTLSQMLTVSTDSQVIVPAALITDSPRFAYRGVHLDEARHFMGADFVKKYIRLAARYKLNYFHWHLTDDQGWRIEIKKYPRLTEIGSRRPETVVGKNYRPYVGDGRPVDGFYTQEQIKDIVAYAERHQVTIVPEIEMPGHASAALAAYPEFGCRPDLKPKVKTVWGGFPDVLCPSDATFGFIDDVLGEVAELFPASPYIHIGADEVDLSQWKESTLVRGMMSRENLRNEHEMLGWFIGRVAAMVRSRGKEIISWDDVIENGVIPDATVMSWKGLEVGATAARAGRKVIMTPDSTVYFDRPQGEFDGRIALGRVTTLADVFKFDPLAGVPADSHKNVIGAQGSMWTEFIKTPAEAEFMAFPRVLALSEALWSAKSQNPVTGQNLNAFMRRLRREFSHLDRQNVNYRIPDPIGFHESIFHPDRVIVYLESPIPNGRVHYTLDGATPTAASAALTGPLILPIDKARTSRLRTLVTSPRELTGTTAEVQFFPPAIPPAAR